MAQNALGARRPRVAVLANIYKTHLHTQHIIDRVLDGYDYGGAFRKPALDVVSIYVEQRGEGDLVPERAKRHKGMRVCGSVAEALMLDTNSLAVDGVIYIGEQGDYPRNQKGQTMYPRYEFFQKVVAVFRKTGKTAPVYSDKHLSWKWEWAKEMYDTSRKMGFPLMAGSSLPVTWRIPEIEMPLDAPVREAMCVAFGGLDSYDIHALEALQCMVERRKGGETGVKAVELLQGDAVWKANEEGRWSKRLLEAALSRTDTPLGLTVKDGRTQNLMAPGVLQSLVKNPAAYCIEYRDGLRATMFMLDGAIKDFNFAASVDGKGVISTQFFLSPNPNVTYSACLVSKIEQMFMTGHAPYSVRRTLLTSGMLESCLTSKVEGRRLETPHLDVTYQGTEQSQYCRS